MARFEIASADIAAMGVQTTNSDVFFQMGIDRSIGRKALRNAVECDLHVGACEVNALGRDVELTVIDRLSSLGNLGGGG